MEIPVNPSEAFKRLNPHCYRAYKPVGEACDDESKLHQQIIDECKRRGWVALHGSMAHKAMRNPGECDFTVAGSNGRVWFIECKTKTGKLSNEQAGMLQWLTKLGHRAYLVRCIEDFLAIIGP